MSTKVEVSDADAASVGRYAMAEHSAWKSRNAARRAFHGWLRTYRNETGDNYEPEHGEPEDHAEFSKLLAEKNEAQSRLAAARAATRRVIVKANKNGKGGAE